MARPWCPRRPWSSPALRAAGKRASRHQEREASEGQRRSPRPAGAPGPEGHSGRGSSWAAGKVGEPNSPLLSSSLPRAPRRGLPVHMCEPKSVQTSNMRPRTFTGAHGLGEAHVRSALPGLQFPSTAGRWAAHPARGSVCPAPGTRASAWLQGPPGPTPPRGGLPAPPGPGRH